MTDHIVLEPREVLPEEDSAKRRQIIEGGRKVFMTQGFDGASMGEIARTAGVSKGTLYVYFTSKEQLFEAIVYQECRAQAEGIFTLDPKDHDIEGVMSRLGVAYMEFLCQKAATSAMRTVIAIADRMPEIGQRFYETGPAMGISALARYLQTQVDAGVLAIDDCEIAAAQFLEACQATLFKRAMFNIRPLPTTERIAYVVGIAVRVFLTAYKVR
jgi:AcrR family transcriptional regulator